MAHWRTWGVAQAGWVWSGTANVAWGRIRAPCVFWPWVPAASHISAASHPAHRALGTAGAFQQVFSPGLQWWLWRSNGHLGEMEVFKDYCCTKASCCSQVWVFCDAGGFSLAPMDIKETWDVRGQHVCEPALALGAGTGWHTSSHCGTACPWCHPASSHMGTGPREQQLSIPAAAWDRGPAPAPCRRCQAAVPACQHSRLPAAPTTAPPGHSQRVPAVGAH